MSQHSRAPWRFQEGYIKCENNWDVCEMCADDDQAYNANADLIAVAPELLEALIELEQNSSIPLAYDDPKRVTARAAIAKAEGKT